jgi:hypothetical protein
MPHGIGPRISAKLTIDANHEPCSTVIGIGLFGPNISCMIGDGQPPVMPAFIMDIDPG